jgi:hypothetical protein
MLDHDSENSLPCLAKELDDVRDQLVLMFREYSDTRHLETYKAIERLSAQFHDLSGIVKYKVIISSREASKDSDAIYRAEVKDLCSQTCRSLWLSSREVISAMDDLRLSRNVGDLEEKDWSEYFYAPIN